MRISCEIIKDLLPLYAEGIASEDTRLLVEGHLKSCTECIKELEEMKKKPENTLPVDTYIKPLKRLRKILMKKKLQTIAFTVILTLTMAAVLIANLTAPEYIPYSLDVVNITEKTDGTVLAEFHEDVSGFDFNRYEAEDKSGYVYHITSWNSYWSRNIINSSLKNTVLNPDGEKVSAVYYYQADSSDSILLYGEDQNPDGGIILLPRLILGYYLLIAFFAFAFSALLLLLFRRNKKARYWLVRITALPASYMLGHLCVRGFYSPTYAAVRNLIAILTIAILMYIAFLLALTLINYYKRKTI